MLKETPPKSSKKKIIATKSKSNFNFFILFFKKNKLLLDSSKKSLNLSQNSNTVSPANSTRSRKRKAADESELLSIVKLSIKKPKSKKK